MSVDGAAVCKRYNCENISTQKQFVQTVEDVAVRRRRTNCYVV